MMSRIVLSGVLALVCLGISGAKRDPNVPVVGSTGPGYRPVRYRAPQVKAREHVPGFLFLEAEGFADYGPWRIDTQFTHKMGSAYLITSGVGRPVGSAVTEVDVPRSGTWHVWARTKDWLPEYSPGAFTIAVGGAVGNRLGVSRRVGWLWERVGSFRLAEGPAEIELRDISGYFGRCDAVLMTTDSGYVPPDDPVALAAERCRLKGENPVPAERGDAQHDLRRLPVV